jgi:RHS repeat-associated protein
VAAHSETRLNGAKLAPMPASSLAASRTPCKAWIPFGKPRSGAQLRKRCAFLTGKERDSESANDYFGARYYWNGAARWLSVDPERGKAADPQSLNAFSYTGNDPINHIDPDGRASVLIGCWLMADSPKVEVPGYYYNCKFGPAPNQRGPGSGPGIGAGPGKPDHVIINCNDKLTGMEGFGAAVKAGWEEAKSAWKKNGVAVLTLTGDPQFSSCMDKELSTGSSPEDFSLRIFCRGDQDYIAQTAKGDSHGGAYTSDQNFFTFGNNWAKDENGYWNATTNPKYAIGKNSIAKAIVHEIAHLCSQTKPSVYEEGFHDAIAGAVVP